jgi:hypothetical protein
MGVLCVLDSVPPRHMAKPVELLHTLELAPSFQRTGQRRNQSVARSRFLFHIGLGSRYGSEHRPLP